MNVERHGTVARWVHHDADRNETGIGGAVGVAGSADSAGAAEAVDSAG